MGEATILAMTSFYDAQSCLTAWSSGTGFAGIAGYLWSLGFDALDTCFQASLPGFGSGKLAFGRISGAVSCILGGWRP